MRDLIVDDIFTMSNILSKMNLKIDFKDIDVKGKTDKELGTEMLGKVGLKVFENLHLAKDEVNNFLGDLNGIAGEDFGKLPIKESMKHFMELKNKMPPDFFDLAGKMK